MQKTSKRVLALVLALIMALSVFSISASAVVDNYNANYDSTTHTVFKHTEQTLAPGVTQYTNFAYTKADGKQLVYYVTTADVTRDDVMLQVSYKDMQHDTFGMQKLSDTVAAANAKYSDPDNEEFVSPYYSVVSATNGNGYNMTTGQPTGVWAMGGEVIQEFTGNTGFFAILKDGRPVMGKTVAEWNAYKADPGIEEAIQAFGSILVWDGQAQVNATGSYYSDRHSRTMMGITEDNKVILIVVDGRQEPFSCGASMAELAQIMLEAGAKYAFNLDGGGSTTYMAKNEGSNDCVVCNRPSDGSERAISNGLIIASLAAPSNVFDHATLTAEDEYISANASTVISATGISPAGTAAEIPAEATLTTNNGTITADGVFTPENVGDATIQMVYDNQVVGETTVHVVVPDSIEFSVPTLAAPYGKDADITMVAKYGEFDFEVKCAPADYQFTLSDNKFGTVDGFTFHATSDTTVTDSGTITASFVGSNLSVTIPLSVGKGSETLFDFEADVDDHQTSRWSGFDGYNAGIVTTCTPVTAENGKVHSGEYAMAYDIDYSQLTYYEDYTYSLMCYNWNDIAAHGFTYDDDGVRQRGAEEDFVDITGATGLGMWMYIPDEVDVRGLDVRYTIGGKKTATSPYERVNSAMGEFFPYRSGLGTDGWYYYYFDLSTYSSWACLRLQNTRLNNSISKNGKTSELYGDVMQLYVNDRAWKDADKQFKSYTSHLTFYIDDITVDYSSVVPDREAPVFTNPNYAYVGTSDAAVLNNNVTIPSNSVELGVTIAENTTKTNATGLDASSVVAKIDGNVVPATFKNGKLSVAEIDLANGTHTVTFEAADNSGNASHMTRTFMVNGSADLDTIKIVPRNTDLTSTLVGSLYYIDIVATDVSKVDSVTTTLKVNNVNDWEIEGIEAADGFTASAEISNFDKGLVDVTVNSLGTVNLAGEAVIASIPVRTWYPHNALGKDSNWIIITKKCVYPMDTQVFTKAGCVTFSDGTEGYFSSPAIQCDSEAMCEYGYIGVNKGNEDGTIDVTSWHEHNAHAIADKPATCTEAGYSGRTFCDECNSVVDWGTVIPATGHNHASTVAGFKYIINGSGWQTVDIDFTGTKGVYITGDDNGKKTIGTYDPENVEPNTILFTYTGDDVPNFYYWLDGSDGPVAWPGTAMTYAGTNDFSEPQYKIVLPQVLCSNCGEAFTGEFTDGKYYVDGFAAQGWIGDKYYVDGTAATGIIELDGKYYEFDENGVSQGLYSGLFEKDGNYYYAKLGELTSGWNTVGEDYYYFDPSDFAAVDGAQKIKGINYTFVDCVLTEGSWVRNGDGWQYMWAGRGHKAGWAVIDGKTYFFNGNGVSERGVRAVSRDGVEKDYAFDDDHGAWMVDYEGLYTFNGVTYYVENGYSVGGGLRLIDGNYYYFKSNKTAVKDTEYFISITHDLLPAGRYAFDENGVMTVPEPDPEPEVKNGIVEENGMLWYYENGAKKSAGLIEIDGDYYYVRSGGVVITNQSYYITNTNNYDVPAGRYNFDENGVMSIPEPDPEPDPEAKNGIVEENGMLWYYENGAKKSAGLLLIDGDYYYVRSGGVVITNQSYYITNLNGLDVPAGRYNFDANGKMSVPDPDPEPDPEAKNGIVEENGMLWYYENGAKKSAGLIEIDGDYYYVRSGGVVITNQSYYITNTNNLLPAGRYNFDANGKMQLN